MQVHGEVGDQMIYLLRKLLSQLPCSSLFSGRPTGQLDCFLIQSTAPNYATRDLDLHNTEQLLSCILQFRISPILSVQHSHSPSLPLDFYALLSLPHGTYYTVGQLSSMVVWSPPYGRCHAQMIRPNYEDICAALINVLVGQPLVLFSLFLSVFLVQFCTDASPVLQPGIHPCTVAVTILFSSQYGPAVCSQVLMVNVTLPSSIATVNQRSDTFSEPCY